ncbi:MAG: 3-oxo-4,17-pregnadiene-20-carboxyl-CoA hydratase beta subunit [Micromonosporaceae bacterium]|jgi:acyl dehydratase|nr:3-oxo-4,17-pregnadiene-20-carboxyl-CoA hydratase beta subunit [Micromonosporaceae bacterium]
MTTLASTRRYDDVQVGDELPALAIPLTVTKIISCAIASRDYQPVHHDQAGARERGSKDIIMNILTTNGLVGKFITDWAGPDAMVRKIAIRLGVSNHPGDTMTLTGTVTGKTDGSVDVKIRGANSLGDHVTGTVTVLLPQEDQ